MKKIATYIIAMAAVCWSCSSEQIPEAANAITPDTKEGVYASFPELEWGDTLSMTRSILVLDGSTMKFAWAANDQIGTYPILTTPKANVMPLTLITTAGSTNGEFGSNGKRYILSGATDKKYTAYFPYKAANAGALYTAVPVDYTGQTQTKTAQLYYYVNNTDESAKYNASEAEASSHLGAYDYLCANAEQNEVNKAVFSMNRLSSIVRFYIQVPACLTYDELQVRNNDASFITKGTVDISSESPSITATETSNSISLSFGSGIDMTSTSTTSPYYHSGKGHQMLVAYMMVAPINLTTGTNYLYLTGHDANGIKKYYRATLAGKNLVAGKVYQWNTLADNTDDATICMLEVTVDDWTENTVSVGQITVNTSDVTLNSGNSYTDSSVLINADDISKLSITASSNLTASIAQDGTKIRLTIKKNGTGTTGTVTINDQATNSMVTINVTIN